MLSLSVTDVKGFMAELLKGKAFDDFGLHSALIHNFACFEISRDKTNIELKWAAVKPFVFEVVKGNIAPRLLKIVFIMPGEIVDLQEANLFLNINFDGAKLAVTSGLAQKNFSADKTPHRKWNEYILNFLLEKNIVFVDELG